MLSIIIFLEFHAFIATLVIFQYLYQQRLEKFELILKVSFHQMAEFYSLKAANLFFKTDVFIHKLLV